MCYRNNAVIKERDMHQSFDGTTATLQIASSKVEHTASYKVVISNEFGSDDSEADLKVTEKKKPPEKVNTCKFGSSYSVRKKGSALNF